MTSPKVVKKIWDLPLRLFHWVLVISLSISIYTGNVGGFDEMDIHMIAGYVALSLILFRLSWGAVGSHHARFINFLRGPSEVLKHASTLANKDQAETPGHNPLGALSVIALILVVAIQAGTGLFANDDILLEGPLVHLVSYDLSRSLTEWHGINAKIIYVLVGLHITAIFYHGLRHGHRLLPAMIHGNKEVDTDVPTAENRWLLAISLALASAGAVYLLITYL